MNERRKIPDRSSVSSQLIGVNDLRDLVFTQELNQESWCDLGITKPCWSTALQSQCQTPLTLVHVSSRYYRNLRRGSTMRALNLIRYSWRVSWLT